MADLTETAQWEAGIYQLETTDKVKGGAAGISNRQGKLLANRTAYLKAMRERGLFSGIIVDGLPSTASIVSSDAGKIKKYLSGTTAFNCTIPTIVSDIIKVGETVTIMNCQSEGEISIVKNGAETVDLIYQDKTISSYKLRPYCSATVINNGLYWEVVNTYEHQSIHGVGEIVSYPTTAPLVRPGLILCNGFAISRTQYSSLFSAIGITFGAGDGSTTFNIPNYPTTLGGVSIRYYIRY